MNMPEARLTKYRQTERYEKGTKMRIRQRDVDMEKRCVERDICLYRRDREVLVGVVASFKYLERPLDQTNND